MNRAVVAAATSGHGVTAGGPAVALLLLLGCEAGLPVPLPADLIMLGIGVAVSGGSLPWWLAVVLVEVVGLLGTTVLLLAARTAATPLLTRIGPRVGLTATRLGRVTERIERRGSAALVLGRATPGLRTLTVVSAGAARLSVRRALPPLLVGSTLFLQGHVLIGLSLGPVIRTALGSAAGRAGLATALVALAAAAFLLRRRRADARRSWIEGVCPACLALSAGAGGSAA